jgi:hypothetical protein
LNHQFDYSATASKFQKERFINDEFLLISRMSELITEEGLNSLINRYNEIKKGEKETGLLGSTKEVESDYLGKMLLFPGNEIQFQKSFGFEPQIQNLEGLLPNKNDSGIQVTFDMGGNPLSVDKSLRSLLEHGVVGIIRNQKNYGCSLASNEINYGLPISVGYDLNNVEK